ncbi:DivIVA domain-containing protein [Plantactinospora sp. CA-294935]|uniref:DivIVA domain-containing protein n=1 Tax=Plantactinospora sp. CA-294935 TaxID=3240012 RepID=UPI003D8AE2EC
MRRLFRFLVPASPPPTIRTGPPNAGRHYPPVAYPPLTAGQIRFQRFSGVRRGLDPEEVRTFLYRVADEFAEVRAELARTRTENNRIRSALRDWQAHYRRAGRV